LPCCSVLRTTGCSHYVLGTYRLCSMAEVLSSVRLLLADGCCAASASACFCSASAAAVGVGSSGRV
jgi:hypothetical protein